MKRMVKTRSNENYQDSSSRRHHHNDDRRESGRFPEWLVTLAIVASIIILSAALFCAAFFISAAVLNEKESHQTDSDDSSAQLAALRTFNLSTELHRMDQSNQGNGGGEDISSGRIIAETDTMDVIASNTRILNYTIDQETGELFNITMDGDAFLIIIHKARPGIRSNITTPGRIERFSDLVQMLSSSSLKRKRTVAQCFGLNIFRARLASGMAWAYDTWNPYNLNPDWLRYQARKAMDTWQTYTSRLLWGTLDPNLQISHINTSIPANNNGMRFATIADSAGRTNTILALTITWYRSKSLSSGYEIFHWNQLYNTGVSNRWGDATQEANVFDLPSTYTHELGHSFGLVDIYEALCNFVTMFFSGTLNEVKKRTLEEPDIQGVQELNGGLEDSVPPPIVLPLDSNTPPLRTSLYSSNPTTTNPSPSSTNDASSSDSIGMLFCASLVLISLLF